MTKKLYYEDCHLANFTARVISCREAEGGYRIVLDQTAFYPEGGGQAWDLGTLDGIPVLSVHEQGEDVAHICQAPLTEGATVQGVVDIPRRFDLMQQHTGEHIVSGILNRMFGAHTVGFHMGSDVTTIDFDVEIPANILPEVERLANEAVWKNLPVLCSVPDPETLLKTVYRTKRALPYPVRLVEVPGYDRCACCGIHVAATGEIGLILLLTSVRFRGGSRIQMLCGSRALQYTQTVFSQNRTVSQVFSAKMLETGAAAQAFAAQLSQEKFRYTQLRRQLFDRMAEDYRGKGDCVCLYEGLDPEGVRELADRIASVCGGAALVISPKEDGNPFCLLHPGEDVRPLGKALLSALGGSGGGKAGMFQGRLAALPENPGSFFVENMNLSL